ncbi:secretin N-terminal domain-containing protein, partial [Luteibacter sp.]|uniref:secretin N-terminal domain-containing protein n=1 Tax=Luteibacter sp. TaxID=1886636 RepID=UPI003F7DA08D
MKRTVLGTAVLSALLMMGCAPQNVRRDDGRLQREALAGVEKPVPASLPPEQGETGTTPADASAMAPGVTREISHGSGRFIRPHAVAEPKPQATGPDAVTLNFEDQPVEAVVKAILGDLLDANYSVTPGVQGTISFSTAKPVSRDEALPILETLLSWTGNALVHEHGRYSILPTSQAVAGRLVPGVKAAKPAPGMSARLFPLRHVAAPAMAKLLAPFVSNDAILLTDPARNVLVIAGTRDELANYGETIDTFDVDWVAGMSVGVFSLRNASVAEVLPALESVFGESSGTPIAGLLRFIPIERT